jgi:hypothetical protein
MCWFTSIKVVLTKECPGFSMYRIIVNAGEGEPAVEYNSHLVD